MECFFHQQINYSLLLMAHNIILGNYNILVHLLISSDGMFFINKSITRFLFIENKLGNKIFLPIS
jgi:hypothetical protein